LGDLGVDGRILFSATYNIQRSQGSGISGVSVTKIFTNLLNLINIRYNKQLVRGLRSGGLGKIAPHAPFWASLIILKRIFNEME
jgi:hypothetical protein